MCEAPNVTVCPAECAAREDMHACSVGNALTGGRPSIVRRWHNRTSPAAQRSEPTTMGSGSPSDDDGFWSPQPTRASEHPAALGQHTEAQAQEEGQSVCPLGAVAGLTPRSREVRRLQKALHEISNLEVQAATGKKLRRNQLQKTDKKDGYIRRLGELGASTMRHGGA